jgi:hypothetical protein
MERPLYPSPRLFEFMQEEIERLRREGAQRAVLLKYLTEVNRRLIEQIRKMDSNAA